MGLTEIFVVFQVFLKFYFSYFHQTGMPYSTKLIGNLCKIRQIPAQRCLQSTGTLTINPQTPFKRNALFSCFVSSTKSLTAPASRIDYRE